MVNVFWMVLGSGQPTFHHATLESAKREAERLARLHPGSTFTVLQSVCQVVKSDVSWETHQIDDGTDIPF